MMNNNISVGMNNFLAPQRIHWNKLIDCYLLLSDYEEGMYNPLFKVMSDAVIEYITDMLKIMGYNIEIVEQLLDILKSKGPDSLEAISIMKQTDALNGEFCKKCKPHPNDNFQQFINYMNQRHQINSNINNPYQNKTNNNNIDIIINNGMINSDMIPVQNALVNQNNIMINQNQKSDYSYKPNWNLLLDVEGTERQKEASRIEKDVLLINDKKFINKIKDAICELSTILIGLYDKFSPISKKAIVDYMKVLKITDFKKMVM